MLFISKSQHIITKIDLTQVPVNSVSVLFSSDFISAIRPGKIILVTLILANSKSVPLQPVSKVAALFQEFQVLFHSDAAQVY